MPNTPSVDTDLATDRAMLAVSAATIWAQQPITATNIYRAGLWPRMDGNRYSNQPSFAAAKADGEHP